MTGNRAKRAVREHGPCRPQRFAAIRQPGGRGEHRLQAFADDELLVGRPQLHDAGRAEHHAVDLLGIGGQRDAVDAGRLAGDGIAHQREQARVPGAGPNRQCGWKRKPRSPMSSGRTLEIDAADLGQIARCQRAGDRLGGVPQFQRARRALGIILRRGDRGTTGPSQLSTMCSASAYSRPSTCISQST